MVAKICDALKANLKNTFYNQKLIIILSNSCKNIDYKHLCDELPSPDKNERYCSKAFYKILK